MVIQDTKTELLKKYRSLDFDDLCILALAFEGVMFSEISRNLRITPPAVSHRKLKYKEIWGDLFNPGKNKFHRELTETGYDVCKKAKSTLYMLMDVSEDFNLRSLFE